MKYFWEIEVEAQYVDQLSGLHSARERWRFDPQFAKEAIEKYESLPWNKGNSKSIKFVNVMK